MAIPKRLYKFCSANDYDFRNLEAGELWFASPADYNDPYDSGYGFDYDITFSRFGRKKLLAVLESEIGAPAEGGEASCSKDELKEKVTAILKQRVTRKLAEHGGVCCFSDRFDNLAMWAYYGGSQRGFCLELDTRGDDIFREAQQVEYR